MLSFGFHELAKQFSRFTIDECYEIPCSFKKMCFYQTPNIIMHQAQNVVNSHSAFLWKQFFVLLPQHATLTKQQFFFCLEKQAIDKIPL
jgi:hypothetical protein